MDQRRPPVRTVIEWKYVYRGFCSFLLALLATGMFFYVWRNFAAEYNEETTGRLIGAGNLAMSAGIYLFLYLFVGNGIHAFRIGVERFTNVVISQILTLFIVDIAEIFVSMAVSGMWRFFVIFEKDYSILFMVQSMIIAVITALMIMLYRKWFPPIDVLEVFGSYKNELYDKVNRLYYKYYISEKVRFDEVDEDELRKRIAEHEAVLINDLPAEQKNRIIKLCFEIDKRVYVVPKISDVILKSSEELNLLDTPIFLCRNNGIKGWQRFVKRFLDITISIVAVILLSPIMLITAYLIHREDGGPVFFRQDRCTQGGRIFSIIKFRSMREDADSQGVRPTVDGDDRITKVGRVIRAFRIDELPQLFNILKGDMSIVGPRPERVEYVKAYTDSIPEFPFRLKMKGGLTGYAQVYGRYNTSALDKLKLDLIYITNYSLILDIQIMIETIKILFLRESTQGFTENNLKEVLKERKE